MADPPIRVVSEQSEQDMERKRARDKVGFALRALAANLLRIIRGAGKSYDLPDEMISCIKAFQAYHDAHGSWPDDFTIQKALDFDTKPNHLRPEKTGHDEDEWRVDNAETAILRAALRLVASRLVDQTMQERLGENDLHKAVEYFSDAQKRRRARYAAARKPPRQSPKRKRPPEV